MYKESLSLLLKPFSLWNDNFPFFSLQHSFLSVQVLNYSDPFNHLSHCSTIHSSKLNTVTVIPRKNTVPSKIPSSQQVIPPFSSGKAFCLVSSYQQDRSFTVSKYWGFSVATGYSIQLFLSPILFLSFPYISPNKLRAMLAAINPLHFCSYILEGFSSPQSCHSQPAQNHPSGGENKALSRYFGFSGTKKNIVQIFILFYFSKKNN